MRFNVSKIPFRLELLFDMAFLILIFLKQPGKLPHIWPPATIGQAMGIVGGMIPIFMACSIFINFLKSKEVEDFFRRHIFALTVLIALFVVWGDPQFTFWLVSARLLSLLFGSYFWFKGMRYRGKKKPELPLFYGIFLRPAQMLLFSFLLVILLGTSLLMLPAATRDGYSLALIDALFMATSAICVTGLATKSLANDFSLLGQMIILILIQIGGLSIMTLYSSLTILLGKSLGMRDQILMQDMLNINSLEGLFQMIVDIIKYTLFIELWGGIALTLAFSLEGFEFGYALYYGFFHSISAFCNAGFSLFDTNLEAYATNPFIHGIVAILVVLGGLGFVVLKELREVLVSGKHLVRLSLHTKTVLVVSIVLTLAGAFAIFFGEFLYVLESYTLWEKVQISLFQSVTLRTAGFNTVPMGNLQSYTLYLMSLFMFIGGSPGSTAGGVKTTTLAILVQSIMATLKGGKSVIMFDRVIPSPLVVKVTALVFISILMTSFSILLLIALEPQQNFLAIFFEAISASGTVGLSLGITPFLSSAGKLAISLLMFSGRIGPLTLILAIGQQNRSVGKVDYPDGKIMIG